MGIFKRTLGIIFILMGMLIPFESIYAASTKPPIKHTLKKTTKKPVKHSTKRSNKHIKKTRVKKKTQPVKHVTIRTAKLQPMTRTISTDDIQNFADYPDNVKELIRESLKLTQMNLTYMYGSASPKNGGMDCSGVIQYVLNKFMDDVPRQADTLYQWAWTEGNFVAVSGKTLDSFEFSKLKPGDILFWSNTYKIERKIPVTHVMMYLGKNKNNQPLLFGSSDGRSYGSKRMYGVSVFDFTMPHADSKSRFLGYSCVPNLTCTHTA